MFSARIMITLTQKHAHTMIYHTCNAFVIFDFQISNVLKYNESKMYEIYHNCDTPAEKKMFNEILQYNCMIWQCLYIMYISAKSFKYLDAYILIHN